MAKLSDVNPVLYGDLETILSEYAKAIKNAGGGDSTHLIITTYNMPTNTNAPENIGVKVGDIRLGLGNGGSFRFYKCTGITNDTVTWKPMGLIHKPTMTKLNEYDMTDCQTVVDWCAWIYDRLTESNDGDYYGSIGHIEFYTDGIVFTNGTTYQGYMTCYLTRATDWGGIYGGIHGYGTDDGGNVYKIYGTDYDSDAPNDAKIYEEKLAVEPERTVIDLKPYVNTNIVDKVNEYLRITITGKTGIIDFGGIQFKSSANGQVFLSGLPFKIKNRAVVNIFRDISQGSTTNTEYCTAYTSQGGNSIMVHSRTANPYYGQMVIELV